MPNLDQAPELKQVGNKYRDINGWGKAIRPHELEAIIANNLGERDFAMYKIMMFLTGNAEGFKVAQQTIMDRCNISDYGYRLARKKLVEKGWIKHEKGTIEVLYDNIYACGLGYTEYPPKKKQTATEKRSSEKQTATGLPSISKQTATELPPSKKQTATQLPPQGYSQLRYNNISNNIINNEQDKGEETEGNTESSLRSASLIASVSSEEPKEEERKGEGAIVGEIGASTLDRIPKEKIEWIGEKIVRIRNIPKAGVYRVKD